MIALKSQIPMTQKFTLAGIFSLGLVITVFSIIRFVLNSPSRGLAGPSWIGAWSSVEQSVSITIACLASFRVLMIHQRRKSKHSPSQGSARNKSTSSAQGKRLPSAKTSFSGLRSHWGNPPAKPRNSGSMELQLLDATSTKSPAPVATSLEHEESKNVF